jgi:hypothetical protein
MIALSYLAGGMIYLICYNCKKPSLQLTSPSNYKQENEDDYVAVSEDFIAVNEQMINLTNTVFSTAFTGILLNWQLSDHYLSLSSGLVALA